MTSGYDCLNKKCFNSQRKVNSELAAVTSVGNVLKMCRAATTSGIHSETDVVAAEKLISAVYLPSTVKTFSQLEHLVHIP